MEDTFAHDVSGWARLWSFSETLDSFVPRILIVEDDRDIRDMLTTLLELAGFACVSCDSTEAGLAALRDRRIDLVLTDYSLPNLTGVWLLDRAHDEGLIDGTPIVIVTAYPAPAGTSAYEIVHKPFDLDDLVERVRQRLHASGPRRRPAPARRAAGKRRGAGDPQCPDPIELILYVSARSPRSAEMVDKFRKALTRFASAKVKLTVCDLSMRPDGGTDDVAALRSAAVGDARGPRTFILGHITNPELVLELLSDCELDGN
jgi:CheY-like chemotaxis protein